MAYGPIPERKKHANRKHGLLYNGHQQSDCMSRSHYMNADTHDPETNHSLKGMITPGQSLNVLMGYDRFNPKHFAKDWYRKNMGLRVPRVAVLSSYIHWWEQWKSCVFQAPIGPLFSSLCPGREGDVHLYNRLVQCNNSAAPITNDPIGADWGGVVKASQVGSCSLNPMQDFHEKFIGAAHEASKILADLDNPIFVVIPNWCPVSMPMKANNLTQVDYVPSGREWYKNAIPMYNLVSKPFHWYYPDVNDYRTQMDFYYQGVPSLICPDPGFGVSLLHIYVGMWAERASNPGDLSTFKFESYPAGPPGLLQSNNYNGFYLGHPLVGFNGARVDWHDCGYDYGYTGNFSDPYPYYRGKCQQGIRDVQQNFYKYRSYTTELYNFPETPKVTWNIPTIAGDRLIYTEGIFWPGECDTICDCPDNIRCGPDAYPVGGDNGQGGVLSYGQFNYFDLPAALIETAIQTYLPPIVNRVDAYYKSIKDGTKIMFGDMIADGGLKDYGFMFGGDAPSSLTDGGKLAAHIIASFQKQEEKQSMPDE